MKDIKAKNKIIVDEYGIEVNPYLTYAQIQQIINSVCAFENWSDRQQNMDMLILYHTTDIGKDNIEKMGHDLLKNSGLIDEVYKRIVNISQVYEGIKYTESIERSLSSIVKKFPKMFDKINEVQKKHGTK